MGVWIDTDMGGDDIFALLMVAHERAIDGVSLTFGVAGLDQVRRNAAGAAAEFGWSFPLFAGCDRSLLGESTTAERVLGASGIRTRGRSLPDAELRVPEGAVAALSRWLETQQFAELLALGPLTNLAVLALSRPDILSRIRCLVWMGGSSSTGNHTAHAEFNAAADPEALQVLLSRGVPIRVVDLHACRSVVVTEKDVTAVSAASGASASLLRDLLGGYLDIALERGSQSMALYDPVAAAALIRPDSFTLVPARVDVELADSESRGRTCVDTAIQVGANAEIAANPDVGAVRQMFLSALGVEA